ncbi:MAG: PEGA domain-containing protein [Chitinispirillaceae bacterium]|nr:PEGA domain-containing protein [Chitinispirillaceae bacterium]
MELFNDIYLLFEKELRKPISEEHIDFAAVEAELFKRICKSEEIGILSLLQIEEISPLGKIEEIEREFFQKIDEYEQYYKPIEECLKNEIEVSEREWSRISENLFAKIKALSEQPIEEQLLKIPANEPSLEKWDEIEISMLEKIKKFDEKTAKEVLAIELKNEETAIGTFESIEEKLERKIAETGKLSWWEQLLKSEEIVPYGKWEEIEENLFYQIEIDKKFDIRRQPFWYIIEQYSTMLNKLIYAGVGVIVFFLSIFAIYSYVKNSFPIDTVVYQAEGDATTYFERSDKIEGSCEIVNNGKIKLINEHGFVELSNTSSLNIEKVSKKKVVYRVRFPYNKNIDTIGKVTFFVKKSDKKRKFTVLTPDYRIEVKGTYFTVEQDSRGGYITKVFEGKVAIKGDKIDTILVAGHSLSYDPLYKKYVVSQTKEKIISHLLEVPEINKIFEEAKLYLHSNVRGTKVYINGIYYGETPLTLRKEAGSYKIRFVKSGYSDADTILNISSAKKDYVLSMELKSILKHRQIKSGENISETKTLKDVATIETKTKVNSNIIDQSIKSNTFYVPTKSTNNKTETSSPVMPITSSENYLKAREAEQKGEWQTAIEFYSYVLSEPSSSKLRIEDALFSIGKLFAEKIKDFEKAKETFETYLNRFPSGTFASECWLRLAELEFAENPSRAVYCYNKFFEITPYHPRMGELFYRVGIIYLQKKQYESAIIMFKRALANETTLNEIKKREVAEQLYEALISSGKEKYAQRVKDRYLQ